VPFRPDRLKNLRDAKGWSQEYLGDRAGLSHSLITKTENGKNSPRSEALDKLAQALDCTTDYLLGRGPDHKTPALAASQMALEVGRSSLTDEQYERCCRVSRHPDAPKTAKAWVSFAEMCELAVGPSTASLALVKGPTKVAATRRQRNDSEMR
jgi:transcriptional regulator with XRE-family HTH domain